MNRLFGSRNAAAPKPSLQDAITSTDTRMDSIQTKVNKLDAELGKHKEQMKKLRDGPGKRAVQARAMQTLKQKRMYESQLQQLQQQNFNMEQASLTTDNLRNTMATFDAMKVAQKEMKKQYGKVDIDKIERLHDEMEDMIEQSTEIQDSLARSYGVPDEVTEDDLQAELDALGDELEEEPAGIPAYLQAGKDDLPELGDTESPTTEAQKREGLVKASAS